jgi:hypothetical protein
MEAAEGAIAVFKEQADLAEAQVETLTRERDEAVAKLAEAEAALEGLKGPETVEVYNFKTTRVVSYVVLNQQIDAALRSLRGET